MKTNQCIPQHISKFALGFIMLSAAMGLVVLGLTLWPIIGLILALPMVALGLYFFRLNLNDQCEMDFSSD
jgi:sensor histidine kinase YesM